MLFKSKLVFQQIITSVILFIYPVCCSNSGCSSSRGRKAFSNPKKIVDSFLKNSNSTSNKMEQWMEEMRQSIKQIEERLNKKEEGAEGQGECLKRQVEKILLEALQPILERIEGMIANLKGNKGEVVRISSNCSSDVSWKQNIQQILNSLIKEVEKGREDIPRMLEEPLKRVIGIAGKLEERQKKLDEIIQGQKDNAEAYAKLAGELRGEKREIVKKEEELLTQFNTLKSALSNKETAIEGAINRIEIWRGNMQVELNEALSGVVEEIHRQMGGKVKDISRILDEPLKRFIGILGKLEERQEKLGRIIQGQKNNVKNYAKLAGAMMGRERKIVKKGEKVLTQVNTIQSNLSSKETDIEGVIDKMKIMMEQMKIMMEKIENINSSPLTGTHAILSRPQTAERGGAIEHSIENRLDDLENKIDRAEKERQKKDTTLEAALEKISKNIEYINDFMMHLSEDTGKIVPDVARLRDQMKEILKQAPKTPA